MLSYENLEPYGMVFNSINDLPAPQWESFQKSSKDEYTHRTSNKGEYNNKQD